ncbi:hypothetical protein K227x_10230 [Rubripirellula lacrimiformis]|uniref:DUF4381 domain-containing protein n=1 Tax=Rubripirellula lacrimiformis TaxID=1930273 RepID=A0A517N684_9BACT|nr:DUF4381 domain-containing protein [Rubripirellula lacrimiformis]QDT02645.1 hypothetical protein K227x_10230 [Rubripirellula lacrimiformis]
MDNATNLDRLHDIVVPPDASWWPPAPGWYLVFAVILVAVMAATYRSWVAWQANAYRRAAKQELESAQTIADISEILRRTALAIAPRRVVAELHDTSWSQWLAATSPAELTPSIREQLIGAIYRPTGQTEDIEPLRRYAADWIAHHRLPQPSGIADKEG